MSNNNLTQLYTYNGESIEPRISLKTVGGQDLFGGGDINIESEKYITWFVYFISEIDDNGEYITPSVPTGGKIFVDRDGKITKYEYPTSVDAYGTSKKWTTEDEANTYAGNDRYRIFYSYVTMCYKPASGNMCYEPTSKWSTPVEYVLGVIGKDGEGIEYMFFLSDKQQTNFSKLPNANWPYDVFTNGNESQKKDASASGWKDDPQGVTIENPYEYVSMRTGSGNPEDWVGCQWSTPSLWSKYGEDGRDGEGIEYIYFLSNSADAPDFDTSTNDQHDNYAGFSIDAQQTPEYLPTTNRIKWTDNYQKPTDSSRYSWVSTRRYKDTGVIDENTGKKIFRWTLFSTPQLWNVFMQSGKAYAELYRRDANTLTNSDTPDYNGNIYYWFNTDTYTSDLDGNKPLTIIGTEKQWNDDYVEHGGPYLYMCEALVDIESIDKPVAISQDDWKNVKLISKDGESAMTFFIDLSNDMDQIYVNDDLTTPCAQTYTTKPTVFNGTTHIKDASLSWTLKYISADGNTSGDVSSGNITADQEFTYVVNEGTKINGDYVFTFAYNVPNTTASIAKTFKLKRIQGTHDYDLWSDKTYITMDAGGNFKDASKDSSAWIRITSRPLNSKTGVIDYLTTVPADCSVVYSDKDTSGEYDSSTIISGEKLPLFEFNESEYTKTVKLFRNGEIVDVIYIDVLKDGKNGEDGSKGDPGESVEFIDLSNEMDQIYVFDTNYPVTRQTFKTVPRVFRGTEELENKTISYTITYDDGTEIKGLSSSTGSVSAGEELSCVFDTSIKIEKNIKCTFTCDNTYSTFSIKRLQSNIDYDLYSNCTVIIKDKKDNDPYNPKTIQVGITSRNVLSPDKFKMRLEKIPYDCSIVHDGSTYKPDAELPIDVSVIDDSTKQFTLYRNGELIDVINIEVLKDGKDGTPGESTHFIDLSNDMDQIYVDENNNPVAEQTFECTPTLFYGGQPLTDKELSYEIKYKDGSTIKSDSIESGATFRYTFNTSDNIGGNIQCVFKYNDAVTSTFNIKRIQGTHDYDLWSDRTYIKMDPNGNLNCSSAAIRITSKPVNSNVSRVEYLDMVPADCSVVYNDGVDSSALFNAGAKLTNFTFDSDTDTKTVELFRNGERVDIIYIDVIRDGESAYFIDLSNDMDQVYVDAHNITVVEQTFTTTPTLFRGSTSLNIPAIDYNVYMNGTQLKNDSVASGEAFTYTIDAGTEITGDIWCVFSCMGVKSTFVIKKLQGNEDYDLCSSATVVMYNPNVNINAGTNAYDPSYVDISINVKPLIGNGEFTSTNIVPANCSVGYYIGSSNTPNEIFTDGSTLNKLQFNSSDTRTVKLFRNDVLADVISIEVLKHGTNGDSVYFIDLSNDMDQVFVDDSSKATYKQTYKTVASLFKGTSKITDKEIQCSVKYSDNSDTEFDTSFNSSTGEFTMEIPAGTEIDKDIYCIFKYENSCSIFVIKRIQGNTDYDLLSNCTYIKKDINGNYTPNNISVDIVASIFMGTPRNLKAIPADCSIKYFDGSTCIREYGIGTILPIKIETIDNDNTKKFELYKSNNLIDIINIEVLKDGPKGDQGDQGDPGAPACFIDLSNDMDQIYVDENNKSVADQKFECTPTLFVGTTSNNDVPINYVIKYVDGTPVISNNSGTIKSGSTFSRTFNASDNIDGNIQCVFKYGDVTSTFNIKRIQGTHDYDLWSDRTYITMDASGNFKDASAKIRIVSKPVNSNVSSVEYLDTVPADCSVVYSDIDVSGKQVNNIFNSSDKLEPFTFNKTEHTKTVTLYRKVGDKYDLVDVIYIDVLKDGSKGDPGAPGALGPIIYPAGVWTSEKTYKAGYDSSGNLTQVPYVEYDNSSKGFDSSYYICLAKNDVSTNPSTDASNWEPMAQFNSVFTRLLVAENGTIGKAVYAGDYMFSQYGSSITHDRYYDASNYKDFASGPENISLETILDNEDFVPNMCLDFKSGAGYFNRGSIKFDNNGLVIGSDVSINANLTVGDFVVNDFKVNASDNNPKDTNTKFVYANNGSWGYVDYGDASTIYSLRAITNEDIKDDKSITIDLSSYGIGDATPKILEGCIIGKPNRPVKFMNFDETTAKLDSYGVLQYVAIADDEYYYDSNENWKVKLLNQYTIVSDGATIYPITISIQPRNNDNTAYPITSKNVTINVYGVGINNLIWQENYKNPNNDNVKEFIINYSGVAIPYKVEFIYDNNSDMYYSISTMRTSADWQEEDVVNDIPGKIIIRPDISEAEPA